jgi:hypothetical protein
MDYYLSYWIQTQQWSIWKNKGETPFKPSDRFPHYEGFERGFPFIYEETWNVPDLSSFYPKNGRHWKVPLRELITETDQVKHVSNSSDTQEVPF